MTTTDFSLGKHNAQLQSARGLAALAVAVGHSAISVDNTPDNVPIFLSRLVFQANTAVVFFFVLSGLVLGSSLHRSAREPLHRQYIKFAIRRFFRLMPIVVTSILVASGIFYLLNGASLPAMAPWFDGFFHLPLSWLNILKSFVFLEERLNGVLWSIRVELLMIPLLPLFAILATKTTIFQDALIVLTLWFVPWHSFGSGTGTEFPLFIFCFYLGIALPKMGPIFDVAKRGDFLLFSLIALSAAEALWLLNGLWLGYKYFVDAIVSGQIILYIMLRPNIRFLNYKTMTLLGDVSYSFYAFGFPLTVTVYAAIFSLVTMPPSLSHTQATALFLIATILAILGTFAFSVVTFKLIETPSIKVGHILSKDKSLHMLRFLMAMFLTPKAEWKPHFALAAVDTPEGPASRKPVMRRQVGKSFEYRSMTDSEMREYLGPER